MIMSREGGKVLCLAIIIMDTVVAILGIEAELSQNKGNYKHASVVKCKEFAHTAFKYGITSGALLVVAHTIANLFGGCLCVLSRNEFEQSTANRRIAAAALGFSWMMLAAGLTLLMIGALMNSQSRTSGCGLPRHPFLLIGGVLCFVHALSYVAYYVSSAAEKERSKRNRVNVMHVPKVNLPISKTSSFQSACSNFGMLPSPYLLQSSPPPPLSQMHSFIETIISDEIKINALLAAADF